jgi:hypothetical protein
VVTQAGAKAGVECDLRALAGRTGAWLNFVIAPILPSICAEFQWKRFSPVWPGDRTVCGAPNFHGRREGQGNILIVILYRRQVSSGIGLQWIRNCRAAIASRRTQDDRWRGMQAPARRRRSAPGRPRAIAVTRPHHPEAAALERQT